jgi:hypothetical protein
LAATCFGHPQRAAFLEQQFKAGAELGAAKIIHNIRGVESLLATQLRGSPKELLVEEQLLHKASQLALKAGKSRARQVHSAEKLKKIETALAQTEEASDEAHEDTTQETTQEAAQETTDQNTEDTDESITEDTKDTMEETSQETTTEALPDNHNILEEVHTLKTDVADALGKSNPTVSAKLESLMDRVGGAQKDILQSEASAASHASELAADVRKAKTVAAGAFTQASFKESSGSQDPVRRVHLAQKALSQLAAAKSEVAEAYGDDDETAKKVSALMDQLSGSLQGLELGSEEDAKATSFKASEDAMFAKIQAGEAAALAPSKKSGKAALLQASNELKASTQARRLMQLAQKTGMLASEEHRISKETVVARQMVDKTLGDTKVGAEVSALLAKAVSEANHAAAGDRDMAAIEARQVQNLLAH